VVDLNETLAAVYVALGPAAVSSRYFTVGDDTHTNAEGAQLSAEHVVTGLRALQGTGLAALLKP
jgi:lysophospholipase L1-like esterase